MSLVFSSLQEGLPRTSSEHIPPVAIRVSPHHHIVNPENSVVYACASAAETLDHRLELDMVEKQCDLRDSIAF